MSNSSKGKSPTKAISVETLRDSLGGLDDSLKALVKAVNKVSDEINALPPLSETVTPSSDAAPEPASKEEPVPKKAPETTAVKPTTALAPEALLEAVNAMPIPELIDKLKGAHAKQNVIKNIISERKQLNFNKFTSLDDLVARVKGLAKPSLDKILERWS